MPVSIHAVICILWLFVSNAQDQNPIMPDSAPELESVESKDYEERADDKDKVSVTLISKEEQVDLPEININAEEQEGTEPEVSDDQDNCENDPRLVEQQAKVNYRTNERRTAYTNQGTLRPANKGQQQPEAKFGAETPGWEEPFTEDKLRSSPNTHMESKIASTTPALKDRGLLDRLIGGRANGKGKSGGKGKAASESEAEGEATTKGKSGGKGKVAAESEREVTTKDKAGGKSKVTAESEGEGEATVKSGKGKTTAAASEPEEEGTSKSKGKAAAASESEGEASTAKPGRTGTAASEAEGEGTNAKASKGKTAAAPESESEGEGGKGTKASKGKIVTAPESESEGEGGKGKKPCPEAFYKGMLDAHNKHRKDHGAEPLTMSDELTKDAQEYANKIRDTAMQHSKDRKGEGENLFASSSFGNAANSSCDFKTAADQWYNEVDLYTFGQEPNDLVSIAHFTQMVWKGTKELGIGVAGGKIVTRYRPAGNQFGKFAANVARKGESIH